MKEYFTNEVSVNQKLMNQGILTKDADDHEMFARKLKIETEI